MGNSSSSSRPHDESVDFGQLVPQGVYTGPRDWNQSITAQLIIARRLAPFYRPLEDYEESWDDDQILAARKALSDSETEQLPPPPPPTNKKRSGSLKEPSRPEAAVYRHAVECPICFLYYPPNINHSRCCDQAICTECFVQIKRNEPTATHLVSEPAACPYCVQENFGVVYTPPPWRAGIASEGGGSPWSDSPRGSSPSIDTPYPTHKRRQKSFGADSAEVVLTDHIRPDWEAKLAAVRAAVQRRANRRIIMRQVGDRLIPVGVTSGRVHALTPEEAAQAEAASTEGSGSRRSRRRQQQPQNGNFEQFMGMGGAELEELMIMEAMRLSLIEHEEQQRKEAEQKKKAETAVANNDSGASTSSVTASSSAPQPSPSTLSVSQPTSSRSRSPSPNPLQVLKDTASGWRRRTSSPPPVTLSAALSAVSTASAVLNSTEIETSNSTPATPTIIERNTIESEQTTAPITNPIVPVSSPTITDTSDAATALEPQPTIAPYSESVPVIEIPDRPVPSHQDSMLSAISMASSTGETYDNLPSSPESDSSVDREPLLTPPAAATPKNVLTNAPITAEGYFGDASAAAE
ncbi:hypothetical protein MIND_01046300 [Mycena indigotica]|uniref:RING-type domain-containing protein n=1 Tax=Mycena indigotica TaxID=2126181 RepID=A0A8H6SAB2_9AGAR|nr:uncharacterized protein MIND_01046300 [Mycena indigotica]KAF7295080.1 hypothetical protein MIND_01046300 [Mycena indigotica]